MTDEHFETMDEKLMSAAKTLREKEVSEGMLKGFSASVERRILAKQQTERSPRTAFSPGWVPAAAVMVLASLVALRLPTEPVSSVSQTNDHVQPSNRETDVEDEIAALKELGVWSDEDEAAIGMSEESTSDESMETR